MPTTVADSTGTRLHVVVGLIENASGRFLIALRDKKRHQGGLWEFPGGKVEVGEPEAEALARELLEEVGIEIRQASYLMDIEHDYPDKAVCLKIWHVTEFNGEAHGKEDQPLCWVMPDELDQFYFPAANQPVIDYLRQNSGTPIK